MASTNQSPFYQKAQGKFFTAKTDKERVDALEEMIKECPKHKSSENMLANLKTRYKKLKEKIEKGKTFRKSSKGKEGIKKEDIQAVIVGFTNSGKSSLLKFLTNAKPEISSSEKIKFTTKDSEIGMMNYFGTGIQLIEVPSIESEYFDKGVVNTTDSILILITNLNQISKIEKVLEKASCKKIIVFNKTDLLDKNEKRKISETLKSKYKKYSFVLISSKTKEGIGDLKNKIFESFNKIRIYTKEPNKTLEESKKGKPIILKRKSTIKEVAMKVFRTNNFKDIIKEIKIWGPSSKFSGQIVGLKHKLKDLDIIEFKTK